MLEFLFEFARFQSVVLVSFEGSVFLSGDTVCKTAPVAKDFFGK
jgi:hypothetical protein